MIVRKVRERVVGLLRSHPCVALIGPRQSGKATLARGFDGAYFDLEQPGDRVRLDLAWNDVVGSRRLVVLDEAQSWPEVFPRLRGAIDAKRRWNGRFLVLGSVSPGLMRQVSESLAGRMALCELTPFILPEVKERRADDLWLRGGYPDGGVLVPRNFPDWQANYLALLAQRDLPTWGLPCKPAVTERFFRMLAASHGGPFNASQLGQSLGLSYHTVQHYLDYLEHAFLLRRLPPYHANLGKRLLKSPKIYWRDSGLLHSLLGAHDMDTLWNQPWVGSSWEGWVIEQILATLGACGRHHEFSFFRSSDGLEADLVLKVGREVMVVEIKLSSQPNPHDFTRLEKVAGLIGANRSVLITRTNESVASKSRLSTNVARFLEFLEK